MGATWKRWNQQMIWESKLVRKIVAGTYSGKELEVSLNTAFLIWKSLQQ